MADQTVVLVTGVARGLGNALAKAFLNRPHHVVIGSVRDESATAVEELKATPTADGSRLIIVKIESGSPSDPTEAVKTIQEAGIDHIDVAIANVGWSPDVVPMEMVNIDDISNAVKVNAIGPIALYRAIKGLLEKSQKSPKWVSISSAAGSLTCMEAFSAFIAPAYAISKASMNWMTLAAHASNKSLIAFAVHPGFVQTDSGNAAAKLMGLEQAPDTVEKSVGLIITKIEKATREETSGKFFNVIDDSQIPW